jgi:hypothetical protein
MALVSPGVQVSIIDESNYLPAPINSVPFILLATAQNKVSGSGVGVAAGTTAENANKVYLISSQRDLAATYGNPFFYKTSNGQPINGYELNEYGLLAAYSVLGISNRAYIQRVDIDLSELVGSLTRPTGEPNNATYWLDTAATEWGIFEWSYITNAFVIKSPIVITDSDNLNSGVPLPSIGNIGDYAVVTVGSTAGSVTSNPVYFKSPGLTVPTTAGSVEVIKAGSWVLVGSDDWKLSWPTVIGTETNPTFNVGDTFYTNGTLITVSATVTVTGLATSINDAAIAGVYANVVNGKLNVYADSTAQADGSTADGNGLVELTAGTGTPLTTAGIVPGLYYAPAVQQSPNYQVPQWRSTSEQPHPTGSVWNKTNNINNGANLVVKKYNSTLGTWITQSCPIYADDAAANKALDPAGGGRNIIAGSTYAQYDVNQDNTFTLQLYERIASGATIVTGNDTTPSFNVGDQFTISWSVKNSDTMTTPVTATLTGATAADFADAWSVAVGINAVVTCAVTSTGAIQIQHTQGGAIYLSDVSGSALNDAGINSTVLGVRDGIDGELIASDWVLFEYTPSASAPDQDPQDGRNWYYSAVDQVDIMINATVDGVQGWYGYQQVSSDVRGFNLTQTNPTGPIIRSTAPTAQSDGSDLEYGDLWIDTSNLEVYPVIKRWESVAGQDQWILVDNSDRTTENGILFADARWAPNGNTDPVMDPIPSIVSLLTSPYLDLDAPDYALYPVGTLLFNTRRSGYNVKSFQVNYFNATDFPDQSLPAVTNAWVSVSGYQDNGAPYMGRRAVRSMVVAAMKAGIDGNQELREEQRQFNLIATPSYPELMPNMVALNNERNDTAFIVGDSPMRLPDTDGAIIAWATNAAGQGNDNEDGLVTHDPYLGVFYPSCQTTDLGGSTVVQPPSHMMLRTIIRNDEVAFPWLAPAGTRRGIVDNAFQLGYVNGQTGAFVSTAVRQGLRDTLYENQINPITYLPGSGIVNYGNKTTAGSPSAMDRINVARLIAYLRGRLQQIGANYVFEPNDQITRDQITNAVSGLLNDLVAKRGIYDYLVVCDLSNNTPARIDANELWVDIAIEPVKAVEFIYIPVRIKNTGEIAAGQVATAATV